jgi:hypothetical protein
MFNNFLCKLWRYDILYFSIIVSIICIISIVVNVWTFHRIDELMGEIYIYDENELTIEEKLIRLEEAFVKFKKMKSFEHIYNWNKRFDGVKYKLDGNLRYNQLDCSGGIFYYAKFHGGNPDNNSSESTYQQMKRLKCKRRIKFWHVKSGDLAFFIRKNRIGHVSFIIDRVGKKKRLIRCLDINSRSNGMGQKDVSFWNARVYSPNFSWWVGKKLRRHLKEYKRRYPDII